MIVSIFGFLLGQITINNQQQLITDHRLLVTYNKNKHEPKNYV
nr:hypothetical protein [Vibrio alginolyticus]